MSAQDLIKLAAEAEVTVEDVARAWASIDGRLEAFDAGRGVSVRDDPTGHYEGYVAEAMELLKRATAYAAKRVN